jgi:hypothetical protein
LVRTRTKDFSGRKPVKKTVKKPEGKKLDIGGLNPKVGGKKNGIAKLKAKKKDSVGGKGRRVE